MKDRYGDDLQVGDCVTIIGDRNSRSEAVVIEVKKDSVKCQTYPSNGKPSKFNYTAKRSSDRVMKITARQAMGVGKYTAKNISAILEELGI